MTGRGNDTGSCPDWWKRNQRVRDQLNLPAYDPPRFEDGVYKHEVQQSLKEWFDCTIEFRSKNPQHPCEWTVYVDGKRTLTIGRSRSEEGNTVFEVTAAEFIEAVASRFD